MPTWPLLGAAFALGAASLLSQLAVIRELSQVLTANELFLGLSLAAWLSSAAVGTWCQSRWAALRPTLLPRALLLSLLLISLGLPTGLLLARSARIWLFLPPGLEAGPMGMLLATFAACALPALGSGLGFATLLSVGACEPNAGRQPAQLAAAETSGACAAGAAYTFALAWSWDPWQLSAWVLAAAGAALLILGLTQRTRVPSLLGLVLLAFLLLRPWPLLDQLSSTWTQISGTRVFSLATARGHASLYRQGKQVSAFYSGAPAFAVPDPARVEPLVLIPLAAGSGPERIALFGDDPEVLTLWLDQPGVREVTAFIPDEQAHAAWMRALPQALVRAEKDPRVRLRFGDGRWWLKQEGARFDAAVLALPPPSTLALNRFYTSGFLSLLARRLEPDGVVVYALPYSPNRLQAQETRSVAGLWRTLGSVFPHQTLLAGESLFLLASARADLGSLTPEDVAERARRLGWQGRTLPIEAVPKAFDHARSEGIRSRLDRAPFCMPNRDAWPIGSGLRSLAWLNLHAGPWPLLLLAGLAVWAWSARKRSQALTRVQKRLLAAGAAAMCLELFVLTAFQSARGDLWRTLGLLFAAYMAGSALGSAWAARRTGADRVGTWTWGLVVLAAGATGGVFWSGGNLGVTLAVLVAGGMCAGALYGTLTRDASAVEAAQAWAADLAGSSAGALLAGTFLLPMLGPYAGLVPAALLALSAMENR